MRALLGTMIHRAILLGALCLVATACASPVSAVRVDPRAVYHQLDRSAVATGEPSLPSRNVLRAQGLLEGFETRPEAALAELHRRMVAAGGDLDALFALAELSFLHAQAAAKREHYLAAAVYAWAFLFPEGPDRAPGRFDPRLRIAVDLYNWALVSGFASADRSEVVPAAGVFALPFGRLDVRFDRAALRAGSRELYGFVPTSELEVQGLGTRYRRPGLGASLAAATRSRDEAVSEGDTVAPRLRVLVTALLRITDARRALVQAHPLTAVLELHPAWDAESVSIAGEEIPLEADPSAALALTFTGLPLLELETLGLLGRLSGDLAQRPPLVSTTPYRRGLIPVVFVHGTQSSALRWAELYNRLLADADIRGRYQFWAFQYDSGNPIVLSAMRLREALTTAVARLDPDGTDPALRRIVLVGHSQGGLLAKMQVISSEDRFWNASVRKPLEELSLSPETRDLARRAMFFEPVPEVSRVVFICTPHRGSFLAGRQLIASLVRWLLRVPGDLVVEVARHRDVLVSPIVASAVDNMSPRHAFIRSIQDIPVSPSVTVNSIIAVQGDGPFEQGDDGVVKYSSAHIERVESELVVRSGHSTLDNPQTIEEVRRILRRHAGLAGRSEGPPVPGPPLLASPASPLP